MDIRVGLPKIRILPTPEARLRTLTQGADHAELWMQRLRARIEPTFEQLYAIRRRVATGAVAVIAVWLFLHVMFGANGMAVYRSKRAEYQNLQKQISNLRKENDKYSAQIGELKNDPKRIEKEAREEFHYARPGEIIYVAPDPPAPAQPTTHSAHK
ncbi:MAG TPA: septum formation initiator family protein [Terriglobales bacterium]|jgi:cell division protein FtsB